MQLTNFVMCPRQWSWPINFPLPLLGIFGAKTLQNGATNLPWADELEHTSLSEYIGVAPYCEVRAFDILIHRMAWTVRHFLLLFCCISQRTRLSLFLVPFADCIFS